MKAHTEGSILSIYLEVVVDGKIEKLCLDLRISEVRRKKYVSYKKVCTGQVIRNDAQSL